MYYAIIIGVGIGGLVCGCYLAKGGNEGTYLREALISMEGRYTIHNNRC
ncbi:MAG: hypothetical protein AB1610_03255 [Nitrospirota bacterium]